ncbi:hypothetical protein SXANM310S_03875 [Streptomyces xanthochromogenes]
MIQLENLVEAIEDPSERLHRAWAIAGHLNAVVNTPELRAAYNACLPLMSEFSTWVGLHRGLYQRYRSLADSPAYAALPPTRRRIIDLALRDFRLSGVELEGAARETYARNADLQAQVSQKFSENVMDATDGWSLLVTDKARLKGLPASVVAAARQSAEADGATGWKLTLHMPCYLPVMQHAQDRELRQALYRAYGTRASDQGNTAFDNSEPIESLLALRAEEAALLGYADFASLQLETRMAHDAPQVLHFLRELAARARPSAERDLAELRTFAADTLHLDTLEPWDVAYASERLREARYAYSDEEDSPLFHGVPRAAGTLPGHPHLVQAYVSIRDSVLGEMPVAQATPASVSAMPLARRTQPRAHRGQCAVRVVDCHVSRLPAVGSSTLLSCKFASMARRIAAGSGRGAP